MIGGKTKFSLFIPNTVGPNYWCHWPIWPSPTCKCNCKVVTSSCSRNRPKEQNGMAKRYCDKAQINAEEFIWGFVKHRWKWLSSPEISSAAMVLNCKSHNWRKSQAENVALCQEKEELQNDRNKKNFEKGTEGVAEAKPLVKSFVGKDRKRWKI